MTRALCGAGLGLIAMLAPLPTAAEDTASPLAATAEPSDEPVAKTVCELIEAAAEAHRIPVDFFTRLIWQESSFRTGALSPKGAQGIAQFMPGTAALRGLADPFDAHQAIPASADYLGDLSARFGNLGLAAAAYNAGEQRVEDWLAGGGLPLETRDYVLRITGRPAEEWTVFDPNTYPRGILPGPKVERGCLELAAILAKPGAGSQMVEGVKQAPWAPWGAQVAGNFSLDRALASYAALQERHPEILGGKAAMVVRAVNRSRGRAALFQIRAPAASRDEATDLCRKLKAAGGACVVFRNR
jgi:soluble lytic murein transglycosylase-like protein